MMYLAFAFNALVLAALVFELYQARRERQQLALLIKSGDVQEFVRAETALKTPVEIERPPVSPAVPLSGADPDRVAAALENKPNA